MKRPRLGLVCISEVLRDTKKLSSKTMTRKIFNSKDRAQSTRELSARILHNTRVLKETLVTCKDNNIGHYRVSSSMFPLITDETLSLSIDDLPDALEIRTNLKSAGDYAKVNDITCSCHPDQFNVLCSYNQQTVERSINELNHQSYVLDMMGLSQDYSSPMCLHLNRSPDLKKETLDEYRDRFLTNLKRCSRGVQSRLVLENEDKGYWSCRNLHELFSEDLPLVYDNLHDACNGDGYKDWHKIFVTSWGKYTPIFHWSEGINCTSKHARSATCLPFQVKELSDVTWEVELKDKDYAIISIIDQYETLDIQ